MSAENRDITYHESRRKMQPVTPRYSRSQIRLVIGSAFVVGTVGLGIGITASEFGKDSNQINAYKTQDAEFNRIIKADETNLPRLNTVPTFTVNGK